MGNLIDFTTLVIVVVILIYPLIRIIESVISYHQNFGTEPGPEHIPETSVTVTSSLVSIEGVINSVIYQGRVVYGDLETFSHQTDYQTLTVSGITIKNGHVVIQRFIPSLIVNREVIKL